MTSWWRTSRAMRSSYPRSSLDSRGRSGAARGAPLDSPGEGSGTAAGPPFRWWGSGRAMRAAISADHCDLEVGILRSFHDVPRRATDAVGRPGAGAGERPPCDWGKARWKRTTGEASGYPRFLRATMSYRETEHLRVLIANERRDRLALVAPIVAALGHEVIAREIEVEDVGAVTA